MTERTVLEIGTITLHWSDWTPWMELLNDNRGGNGVGVPASTGVYEVKYLWMYRRESSSIDSADRIEADR